MTLPKLRRGIGFPDPNKYYVAVNLRRTIDWCIQKILKLGLELKQTTITVSLESIIRAYPAFPLNRHITTHPLVVATFRTVKSIFETTSLSLHPSPFLLIFNSNFLPHSSTDSHFCTLYAKGIFRLCHLTLQNKPLSIATVQVMFALDLDWLPVRIMLMCPSIGISCCSFFNTI